MSFKVNLQEKMRICSPIEQIQVNLVHAPKATGLRQAQNKIIISGIDLCEGLNQGPDTKLYHTTFPQAWGYFSTFISAFLCLPFFSLKK